jgi:4-nitrophenyl phosphatase
MKIGFLIDLDGTIYKGRNRIEGADQFIRRIRELGIPFQFVTNNSSRTPESVAEHLIEMNIPAQSSEVYTAAQAAAAFMLEDCKGKKVFYIGETGLEKAIVEAGFIITNERPDYVVQGIDRTFNYEKLKQAVRLIQEGAVYILTNPDLLLPSDDGLNPGAGTISAAIIAGTGVQPIVIGKPSNIIMNYAIKRLGLPSRQIWVIGDNMMTDIGAGKASGCNTGLILTGVVTKHNIADKIAEAGFNADVVCDDLITFLEQIHPYSI